MTAPSSTNNEQRSLGTPAQFLRGVGPQREEHQVQPDTQKIASGLFISFSTADFFQLGIVDTRLGLIDPSLGELQLLLGLANRIEILLQLLLVGATELSLERVCIGKDGVEKIIEIELSEEATANFNVSVDAVKELLEACKGLDSSLA